MKKSILASVLLTLFSPFAFAVKKGFDIKMDIVVDGKTLSSPRIQVLEGVQTTVTERVKQEKTFFNLVATQDKEMKGKQTVLMKFEIGKFDEKGQKIVVGQPQIIAFENEPASISVGTEEKEAYSISVIAQKKIF